MIALERPEVKRKPCAVVEMPDGELYPIFSLLGKGPSNAKTAKNIGVHSLFLSILPHKVDGLGNVCPHATPGCVALCINESGRSMVPGSPRDMILGGRLARRILYFRQRAKFLEMYHWEIRAGLRAAEKRGVDLLVRLNTFSDIDWCRKHPEMILEYPEVTFHDYTKDADRFRRFLDGELPPNYHLTFSRSEENEEDCLEFLRCGGNCAVVFAVRYNAEWSHPLPQSWRGFEVFDGDKSDMRHLDPRSTPGKVIGLRAKGKARGGKFDDNPFIVKVA